MRKIILPFYARLALILLSIVLITFLLFMAQEVLIPLFFAVMVAFLLYPMATWLEKRTGLGRGNAAFLSVLAFVAVLGGFIYVLTLQILEFSQDIPKLQRNINAWMLDIQHWIGREYQLDSTQQIEYTNGAMNSLLSSASMSLGGMFVDVANIVFWIIIVFIYTYFILHHRRLILRFLLSIFPEKYKSQVSHVVFETRGVTNGYLIGLLIEFVVIAIANCATLWLLGVRYAMLLGLLAAALNVIPYLGILIATGLIFMVTMVHGTPLLAIKASALIFFLHVLDANILFPKVVGDKVKMNALITIVSVLVGGAIWGVAGMFLSIPVSAMLKIVFEHVDDLKPWAMLMGTEDDKNIDKK